VDGRSREILVEVEAQAFLREERVGGDCIALVCWNCS
jgi:hypothetical protein